MDMGDSHPEAALEAEDEGIAPENESENQLEKPRVLPSDLPTSLDDRRRAPEYAGETEMYDGWQGMHAGGQFPLLTPPPCGEMKPSNSCHLVQDNCST